MADAKLSALNAIDAIAAVDLLLVVDDPAGTPISKKATAAQLATYVVGTIEDAPVYKGSYAPGSVIVQVGDSNTDDAAGRPGWNTAVQAEWYTLGGWLYGCTDVNLGQNGATIQGWAQSIGTPSVSTTLRGNLNVVVNNNPDLVIVALGTNERSTAARRAAEGDVVTGQTNFDTVINFLLDNTTADICLRLPAPYGAPNDIFTDFADQTERDASSAIIRQWHLTWKYHPRVRLCDTHEGVFGLTNDSITTDSLDAETSGPLLYDELHNTDLGYRRVAEFIAQCNTNRKSRIRPQLRATPDAFKDALWSETMYLSAIESSGTILNLPIDPVAYVAGRDAARRNEAKTVGSDVQALIHPVRLTSQLGGQLRLYLAGGAANSIRCFCHNSGNVYTMTSVSMSNHVTATAGNFYDQATPQGLSAPFVADDVGPITFSVDNVAYIPNLARNTRLFEVDLVPLEFDRAIASADEVWWRANRACTGITTSGFCGVAPSGDSSQWTAYHYPGGIGGAPNGFAILSFADGTNVATSAGTVDVAVGDLIKFRCTSSAGGGKAYVFNIKGSTPLY